MIFKLKIQYVLSCLLLVIICLNAEIVRSQNTDTLNVVSIEGTLDRPGPAGWTNGGTWIDQHNDISKIGKIRKLDLVFLGNSITQSWCNNNRNVWAVGQKTWDEFYGKRNAANFGISGDRVENILWRIENGNFDNCSPKVIVILIGTNNIEDNSVNYIATGIQEIQKSLLKKLPDTKILQMGILPRGESRDHKFRSKIQKINKLIEKYAEHELIHYKDIGSLFLKADGKMNLEFMRTDFVHLNSNGYRIWAEAIEALLVDVWKN